MADKMIQVKLVRGLSGRKKDQIATVNALGLRKIGDVSAQPDNEATRGKLAKVAHMVEVVEG
jgi:large subunit ribosomal protein L30